MPDPAPELIQFPYSHYNEKARWALDWKRIPHRRRSLLPGPHARTIERLTGQSQVPVLRVGGELVCGSARVIETLEQRQPDPPLYPAGAAERARSLEIAAWFDDEVGPLVRRALFARLLAEPGYVCRIFSEGHPALSRLVYRAVLPLLRGRIRRDMGIRDERSVRAAVEGTRRGLDFVAEQGGAGGVLVGDAFSVADMIADTMTCDNGEAVAGALDAIEAEGCHECFMVPATLETLELDRLASLVANRRS